MLFVCTSCYFLVSSCCLSQSSELSYMQKLEDIQVHCYKSGRTQWGLSQAMSPLDVTWQQSRELEEKQS